MTSGGDTVAITGMGCITAAGRTLPESYESIMRGFRRPEPPAGFRTDHKIAYPVFEIPPEWTPDGYNFSPACTKCGGLAVIAAREALQDAGVETEQLSELRVGVCIGTTVGNALNDEDFMGDFISGRFPPMEPILDFLSSNPSFYVARALGVSGPVQTINTACTSGAAAIGEAASWIRQGLCDLAIAGGSDKLSHVSYDGFISLKITDPEPCRPYDRNRLGLNLGEGAGIVILESRSSLIARNGRARGRLTGYGNASDAYHLSAPDPDGRGLARAIDKAFRDAGLRRPSDIAFINSHGTGTPDNDRMEGRLYPRLLPEVPFVSTKGYTGHTLGASGGIEAVLTLACLEEGRIPGNIGFVEPDPGFDGRPATEVSPVTGDTALSVSVAFGGNNVVLALAREM